MLKKAVQQGRSKRRGAEVRTALRVGRSHFQWVLANGKAPPVFPASEKPLLNVEPLSEARTPLADFFSILLEMIGDADQDMLCSVDTFKASSSDKGLIEP